MRYIAPLFAAVAAIFLGGIWYVTQTRQSDDPFAQCRASQVAGGSADIGGPFELLFAMDEPEGRRGSEGCRYLAYVPGEMVAFTWNAPPHLALRETNTWVVVTFTALSTSTTAVRLVHTGFLEGPDWDDYMSYFERAWDHVLGLLSNHWAST